VIFKLFSLPASKHVHTWNTSIKLVNWIKITEFLNLYTIWTFANSLILVSTLFETWLCYCHQVNYRTLQNTCEIWGSHSLVAEKARLLKSVLRNFENHMPNERSPYPRRLHPTEYLSMFEESVWNYLNSEVRQSSNRTGKSN